MKRIFLYLITNLSVLLMLGIVLMVLSLLFEYYGLDLRAFGLTHFQTLAAIMAIAAILGFGGSILSLLLSARMVIRATGARVLAQAQSSRELWLLKTVARLARQARVTPPRVALCESPSPNALAAGSARDKAVLVISSGLMEHMAQDQIEAVLAHEMHHVASGDMATLGLIQGTLNIFVLAVAGMMSRLFDRLIFRVKNGFGPAHYAATFLTNLALAALASMLVAGFARRRVFRGDAGAAHLAGREKMLGALEALQQDQGYQRLPAGYESSGISNGPRRRLKLVFNTHPLLEQRIAALKAGE